MTDPLLDTPIKPTQKGQEWLSDIAAKLCEAVLVIASTTSLIALIYYAIPGFFHVFAIGNPAIIQPTHIAVCAIVFLVSTRFLPSKEKSDA
jgi:hypothetical protein